MNIRGGLPIRIAIYARTSTSGGKQELDNQLLPLREWADRLGGQVVTEYIDEASGSRSDRVALNKMLEDSHQRRFDVLLVWALDRLSREGIARLAGYLERLKMCGVRVMSNQESWLNTAGPLADLLIAIFGWVAQQERTRIRERVLAGLKIARAKGKKLGRPKRSFDTQKAKLLYSQGYTMRQVAQMVGIPRATLSRVLSQKPIVKTV